jgi:hypothetical protein
MPPVLTTVSPLFGPPGAAIALTGSGFTAASQVGCPALVATAFVSATQITAAIPANLSGPAGGSTAIGIFVFNADGTTSGVVMFLVEFPPNQMQAWTTVDAVCGEVPGFARGGQISDTQISNWIASVRQSITGAMLGRGLSLDPALWQQPDDTANPDPSDVLEMINRYGAAARLSAAVSSLFSTGPSDLTNQLKSAYGSEMARMEKGGYDKLFLPSAGTLDPGPELSVGDMSSPSGRSEVKFRKDQRF